MHMFKQAQTPVYGLPDGLAMAPVVMLSPLRKVSGCGRCSDGSGVPLYGSVWLCRRLCKAPWYVVRLAPLVACGGLWAACAWCCGA
jgi:hypothetical protein